MTPVTIVDALPDVCKCGGALQTGYGLAGGGFGEQCCAFYKIPEPDEDHEEPGR